MTALRYLRQAKGLTQKRLAQYARKTEGCICQYETGIRNMPVETAKRIAPILGCKWSDLYEDVSNGSPLDG